MVAELTAAMIRTIRDAARRRTGAKRRQFEAEVAIDYGQGSARKAETIFGWGRVTVQAGLEELRTGTACQDRYGQRGRRKTEEKLPTLEEDIRTLLEPQTQTDPKFQSSFLFTRATGRGVRESEQQEGCLRISIDAKAKVKVGEFSRGGKSRGRQAKKAGDHDMNPQATLVPFGILETASSQLFTVFGTSRESE